MINDISGFISFYDYGWLLNLGFIIFVLLIVLGMIISFIFYRIKLRRMSLKLKHLKMLRKIDFKNSKEASYILSEFTIILCKDNSRLMKQRDYINKLLYKYKYKKNVESFSHDDKVEVDNFLKEVYSEFKF